MSVEYSRARNCNELEEILKLQRQNLASNISKETIQKEGFVTVSHTLELLQKMNDTCPHIVAKDKDRVVGYALCMHPNFSNEIPILQSMFKELRSILSKDESFIVMGQVCIEKEYRGKGIFRGLYNAMKHAVMPKFKYIVTEVDAANQRSLNAHLAIGFKTIKKYHSDGREWYLICWNG